MCVHKEKFANLLEIYLLQIQEDINNARMQLLNNKPNLSSDAIYNIGTWVWLLQRQISKEPENKDLIKIDYLPYIDFLCNEWNKEHAWLWDDKRKDVFLSNIGIIYAALMETKKIRKLNILQKTMTEIRDYVFDNLLTKGTMIGGKKFRKVSVDQVLSVIPFGLFSPEDLIVVEAVKKMELYLTAENGLIPFQGSQADHASATAILALYYLEKSDLVKAKYYYELANKVRDQDNLARIVLEIYQYYYSNHYKRNNQIFHDPLGNENVYEQQLTERIPHYPTLNDYLRLACEVDTDDTVKNVFVKINKCDGTWSEQKQLDPVTKNNVLIYETKIPPLPEHGKYIYSFLAELENGRMIQSEEYELTTLDVKMLKGLELVSRTDQKMLMAFTNENIGLEIEFVENNLKFTLINNFVKKDTLSLKDHSASIHSGEFSLTVGLAEPKFEVYKKKKKILETHPLFAPIEWKRDAENNIKEFTINWFSPADEKFFGFGERYNQLEQRGRVIDCFVYNQYRDQGTRTYMPIPFYLTNREYGCFIDTLTYTKFDLASELNDKCSITIEQTVYNPKTEFYIFFGNYKEQIQSYIKLTGQPKMIPAWAMGPWMSSNNWDRQAVVRKEIETTKALKIPATVIVLEQWSDETTFYMFNDAEYELKDPSEGYKYEEIKFPEWGRWPDPKGMIDYIHDNKMKLLLWQIPVQKYLNKQSHPLKDLDEEYMIEKGYVVKNPDGTPYRIPEGWFTGSLIIDFSNEEARDWWFRKRQYLIDIGVDGFKTDGGEFVFGRELVFANGKTGAEMRNRYPNDYVSAYYSFAQQNQGITFSRAGYTGAHNFPAHWAGDERSTFSAFRRSLIAGLTAGMSGIIFWGWDLAGFNGDIPTAELYLRSAAMATFCPIMQYHAESKAEFNQDRTPWNIAERTGNQDVIAIYRFFANLRMNLIPYIYHQASMCTKTGLPLMRALMIEYPEDPRVQGMYDQYLFGDSFLVAPIIEEGALTRKVYLPEGVWFDLWTGEKISGPALINVSAPIDKIPVFVKANSAILLNLDSTKTLGSWVGNDVETYDTPVLRIYYHEAFTQTISDHLGNEIKLSVYEEKEHLTIKISSSIDNLEIDVVGNEKKIKLSQGII